MNLQILKENGQCWQQLETEQETPQEHCRKKKLKITFPTNQPANFVSQIICGKSVLFQTCKIKRYIDWYTYTTKIALPSILGYVAPFFGSDDFI